MAVFCGTYNVEVAESLLFLEYALDESNLKKLLARSPEDVIRALVTNFRKPELDRQPPVEITVGNGMQSWTGWPVQIADAKVNMPYLTLFSSSPNGNSSVSFLPLLRIESVTVHNVKTDQSDFFAPGSVKPRIQEAPGRVEMKKMGETMAAGLAEKGWSSARIDFEWGELGSHSDALQSVYRVLRAFSGVIERLLEDDIGREALDAVKSASLQAHNSATLTCALKQGRLQIVIGKDLLDKNLSATLYEKIQSVL